MPFTISIGSRKIDDGLKDPKMMGAIVAEPVTRDDAPVLDHISARTGANKMTTATIDWDRFSTVTNLKAAIPPYGATKISPALIETVRKAEKNLKSNHPPAYTQYLQWVLDWCEWALKNCKSPVIVIR